MSRYEFQLAQPEDDADLRRRMAEDVLDGTIAVTFRREPDYFAGTALQGSAAEVMKCVQKPEERIVGLCTRTRVPAYINGEPQTVGYLCDLRADPSVRGGTLLARGFRKLRELHEAAPLPLYFTMILDGNDVAIDVLTSGRASLPQYRPLGRVLTPALHLDRPRRFRSTAGIRIATANATTIDGVIEFVNREFRKKQFAPAYGIDDLRGARLSGLRIEDIYVAFDGERIVGCIACWDQSHVRQVYVERYSRALKLARPFYNLFAGVSSRKALPDPGNRIPFFYLAWIAVENDDRAVFRELLEHIYAERRQGPWHFFIAGLHEDHPLAGELDRFRGILSSGHLFAVHWADGQAAFDALDGRVPHVEAGAL